MLKVIPDSWKTANITMNALNPLQKTFAIFKFVHDLYCSLLVHIRRLDGSYKIHCLVDDRGVDLE